MIYIRKLIVLLSAIFVSFAAHSDAYYDFDNLPTIDPDLPAINYITFPTLTSPALTEHGEFRVPAIPAGQTNIPAVVIMHGTHGIDNVESFYEDALNDAGIATLVLDMYATRGLVPGVADRPNPLDVLPDVYGALKFLASQPGIDTNRIGLLGESAGGVLTVITSTGIAEPLFAAALGTLQYAGFVAQSPVCYLYNI